MAEALLAQEVGGGAAVQVMKALDFLLSFD